MTTYCKNCGGYIGGEIPPNTTISGCTCKKQDKGWICPVCGTGNAPWAASCGCVHTQDKNSFFDREISTWT